MHQKASKRKADKRRSSIYERVTVIVRLNKDDGLYIIFCISILCFSSPFLLSVACLLISWLNRQITLFPYALKGSALSTKSGLRDMAMLTYPASEQAGILWSWWAQGRRPAPAGASHRHAAAGTEVLSGGRGEEGNKLFSLALCHSSLLNREPQRCLTKLSCQVSVPQTWSQALPQGSSAESRS